MVIALTSDVALQVRQLRLADGEGAVAVLPSEVDVGGALLLYPVRGILLDLLNEFAHRNCPRQSASNVNMFVSGANAVGRTVKRSGDGRDVFEKFTFDRFVDKGLAVLGAEDDMEEDVGERLRHVAESREGKLIRQWPPLAILPYTGRRNTISIAFQA